tara:strand:- start:900 stop:1304 length:405 start_codon:yes stop_codon:yes gene_type:complete
MSENKKLLSVIHKVSDSQIVNYSKTSGDINPIHLDSSYAKNTQFGERIAHGMLIISFISDFMYKNFEEKWIHTGSLKIKFKAPVFINDEIYTEGIIKNMEKKSNFTKITCSVNCTKQNGEKVISGITTVNLEDL